MIKERLRNKPKELARERRQLDLFIAMHLRPGKDYVHVGELYEVYQAFVKEHKFTSVITVDGFGRMFPAKLFKRTCGFYCHRTASTRNVIEGIKIL